MNWFEALDLYCERGGPGLLAEPVNALTNLGFVLAAFALLRRIGADGPPDLRLLAWLIAAVGAGSLVFHTVAQRWASLLDIAFIALFVVLFVQRALVRLLGWREPSANAGAALFVAVAATIALTVRIPALNGSDLYLGPWMALLALAATCRLPVARRWLIAATTLFVASLAFRSLDLRLCTQFPLGTHFGWHLNNALVLWCCMQALLSPEPNRPTAGNT